MKTKQFFQRSLLKKIVFRLKTIKLFLALDRHCVGRVWIFDDRYRQPFIDDR